MGTRRLFHFVRPKDVPSTSDWDVFSSKTDVNRMSFGHPHLSHVPTEFTSLLHYQGPCYDFESGEPMVYTETIRFESAEGATMAGVEGPELFFEFYSSRMAENHGLT